MQISQELTDKLHDLNSSYKYFRVWRCGDMVGISKHGNPSTQDKYQLGNEDKAFDGYAPVIANTNVLRELEKQIQERWEKVSRGRFKITYEQGDRFTAESADGSVGFSLKRGAMDKVHRDIDAGMSPDDALERHCGEFRGSALRC